MTDRRHLLVVATQCATMPHLDRLGEAARALRDILRDPWYGGCEAGLSDGTDLLTGDLDSALITARIGDAARHAQRREATLILALLGHGFVPGNAPHLYFMGTDAQDQVRDSAVDVNQLVMEAVDRPGVNGLVALVDTCMAAGAAPRMADLLTGVLQGRTRLAMLLAAAVGDQAYDLRMSRTLAAVLRSGRPEAGQLLDVNAVLPAVRAGTPGQDPVGFGYEGNALAGAGLWLAHNRRHAASVPARGIGRLGWDRLHDALRAMDRLDLAAGLGDIDLASLEDLYQQLCALPSAPECDRAIYTVKVLQATTRTVRFLRSWMPHGLTTSALRRSIAAADRTPAAGLPPISRSALVTEVDYLEYVAFYRTGLDGLYPAVLARYVAALAISAGMDRADPAELRDWADSIGASFVHLNDAVETLRSEQEQRRLRLIVSLHGSLTGHDWPEQIDAWLLCDGQAPEHDVIDCRPDQAGVEDALREAVHRAEGHAADLGLKLRRIEVAVPARLLLGWHPEEVQYGTRLGVDYDVVIRWSSRLNPPERWILKRAEECLAKVATATEPIVHWLDEQLIHEPATLQQRLADGRYLGPIGLHQHPGEDAGLLDLLLAFTAILLWPRADAQPCAELPASVAGCWEMLPGELLTAYRRRWSAAADEPIANLRAVWDDEEWLEFCRRLSSSRNG